VLVTPVAWASSAAKRNDQPSKSVWRAAGIFMPRTKSETQTMHTLALTALFGEVLPTLRPFGGVKAGVPL